MSTLWPTSVAIGVDFFRIDGWMTFNALIPSKTTKFWKVSTAFSSLPHFQTGLKIYDEHQDDCHDIAQKKINKLFKRQIQALILVIVVECTRDWFHYLAKIQIHDSLLSYTSI